MQRATLDRLIEILQSARDRKRMYFRPIGPVAVEHWMAAGETKQLRKRGLSPEAIVDELLSIEIEMWASHREQLP